MFVCVLSRCLSPVVEIRDVKCLCVLSRCLSPVLEIRDVKCLSVLPRCLSPVVLLMLNVCVCSLVVSAQ